MSGCSPDICGWVDDVPPDVLLRGVDWWCGDDWCNCSEARIESYRRDRDPWIADLATVWTGDFHTDGEPGSSTELNRMAQHLRRHHHDLYARIRWPWTDETEHAGR